MLTLLARVALPLTLAAVFIASVSSVASVAEARSRKPKERSAQADAPEGAEKAKPKAAGPIVLSLGWHESPQKRRLRFEREREARRRLRPALEAWATRWNRESRSFLRAFERASSTLATVSDRRGRNTCYPLETAAQRLRREMPQAPEVGIETDVRAALAEIEVGAQLCRSGLTTTAQRAFAHARGRLARAQARITLWREEGSTPTDGREAPTATLR